MDTRQEKESLEKRKKELQENVIKLLKHAIKIYTNSVNFIERYDGQQSDLHLRFYDLKITQEKAIELECTLAYLGIKARFHYWDKSPFMDIKGESLESLEIKLSSPHSRLEAEIKQLKSTTQNMETELKEIKKSLQKQNTAEDISRGKNLPKLSSMFRNTF